MATAKNTKSTIENNIKWLKEHNYIKRHGASLLAYQALNCRRRAAR